MLLGLSACVRPLSSEYFCIKEDKPSASEQCKEAFLQCDIQELLCCARQGDVHAQLYLGQMYLTGWKNVVPDPKAAAYWFTKVAECGLSIGQVQLGHLYRDGVGVSQDLSCAIKWYEYAAAQGDISAMLTLGELSKGRYGAKANYKVAMEWFQMAANLGSYEGELQVAWLLVRCTYGTKGRCQAVDILIQQAKLGNPNAYTQLGDFYFEGYNGRCNLILARENYESAACLGSAEAMFKLAMMYALGQGVCRDHTLATPWVMKAATLGYLPAEVYLADMYRDGRGVDKNYRLAAQWYWKSVAKGSGIAEIELADLIHAGKGAPRDLAMAAHYYELGACHTQHPYPALMLSVLYAHGRGVTLDLAKSVNWYNCASKHTGFSLAEYKIGRRYALGFGLKRDMKEALRWYRLAAACALPIANIELGDIDYHAAQNENDEYRYWLAEEPGFPKGLTECELTYRLYHRAYDYYRKAALKGHSYAQYMMGIMELEGTGVSKNWASAVVHIRKAAYQGARQAQYQLGLLYLRGMGVKQSDTQAYGWFKIALEEETDITPQVIVFLIDKMDPKSRAQAVRLSEEYERKYQFRQVIACPKNRQG